MPVMVTLQQIRDKSPCSKGWELILAAQGGDNADLNKPFPLSDALKSNPLPHVVWALRCLDSKRISQEYALGCAEMVKHIMKDKRSLDALVTIRRFLDGGATQQELSAARQDANAANAAAYAAAYAAADAAYAAADAAANAAYAAYAAADAAANAADAAAYAADAADAAAAYAAADAAADAAANAAANAADAAADAAAYAAKAAANAADAAADARKEITEKQRVLLLSLLEQEWN